MKTLRILLGSMTALILFSACSPLKAEPTEDPNQPVSSDSGNYMPSQDEEYSPQPEDVSLTRDTVYIDSMDLLIMESYPPQISLHLVGSLPTPCHLLRVEAGLPDEDNIIRIGVYSVVDPNLMCAMVLQPFEQGVGLGSFPAGDYEVYVNDILVGEFSTP